jgi:nucleotide-binding universal stress UspA family protein
MVRGTIVVGMDGSPGGRRALAWALDHAATTGAAVEVVTAYDLEGTDWFDPDGPVEQREAVDAQQCHDVEAALREIDQPPTVRQVVIKADPVQALLHAAKGADLLVLGSHGRTDLASFLRGTTAARCARRSATPVVVVPEPR